MARAQAEQHHSWWDTAVSWINKAAPIITAVAIATSVIPLFGEATGLLALAVNAVSLLSTAADVATIATNGYATFEDVTNPNKKAGVLQTLTDIGATVLSVAGAGAAAKLAFAASGMRPAVSTAKVARGVLDKAVNAGLAKGFSGPPQALMRAFKGAEGLRDIVMRWRAYRQPG